MLCDIKKLQRLTHNRNTFTFDELSIFKIQDFTSIYVNRWYRLTEKDESLELEDLPGVGPATAVKLKESGFATLEALAVASPKEVSTAVDIGETTVGPISKKSGGGLAG